MKGEEREKGVERERLPKRGEEDETVTLWTDGMEGRKERSKNELAESAERRYRVSHTARCTR